MFEPPTNCMENSSHLHLILLLLFPFLLQHRCVPQLDGKRWAAWTDAPVTLNFLKANSCIHEPRNYIATGLGRNFSIVRFPRIVRTLFTPMVVLLISYDQLRFFPVLVQIPDPGLSLSCCIRHLWPRAGKYLLPMVNTKSKRNLPGPSESFACSMFPPLCISLFAILRSSQSNVRAFLPNSHPVQLYVHTLHVTI